jgi:hypothetical protein
MSSRKQDKIRKPIKQNKGNLYDKTPKPEFLEIQFDGTIKSHTQLPIEIQIDEFKKELQHKKIQIEKLDKEIEELEKDILEQITRLQKNPQQKYTLENIINKKRLLLRIKFLQFEKIIFLENEKIEGIIDKLKKDRIEAQSETSEQKQQQLLQNIEEQFNRLTHIDDDFLNEKYKKYNEYVKNLRVINNYSKPLKLNPTPTPKHKLNQELIDDDLKTILKSHAAKFNDLPENSKLGILQDYVDLGIIIQRRKPNPNKYKSKYLQLKTIIKNLIINT